MTVTYCKGGYEMAVTGYSDNKIIRSYIDRSGVRKPHIYTQLGMTRSSFSKRYLGHVRWKTEELKRLAPIIGYNFYDLV
jgi:hypothetical protein